MYQVFAASFMHIKFSEPNFLFFLVFPLWKEKNSWIFRPEKWAEPSKTLKGLMQTLENLQHQIIITIIIIIIIFIIVIDKSFKNVQSNRLYYGQNTDPLLTSITEIPQIGNQCFCLCSLVIKVCIMWNIKNAIFLKWAVNWKMWEGSTNYVPGTPFLVKQETHCLTFFSNLGHAFSTQVLQQEFGVTRGDNLNKSGSLFS